MSKVFLTGGRSRHLLQRNDVITRLDVGDTLAYGLHDPSTLMPKHDGEGTLRVLAGQSVCICEMFSCWILQVLNQRWLYLYGRHQCIES